LGELLGVISKAYDTLVVYINAVAFLRIPRYQIDSLITALFTRINLLLKRQYAYPNTPSVESVF